MSDSHLDKVQSGWSGQLLGGVAELGIEWRLSMRKSQAVEWRLLKEFPTDPSVAAQGVVSRDMNLQTVDLKQLYHNSHIMPGQVGLRFEQESMSFWCRLPLGAYKWIRVTVASWPLA